MTAAAGLGARDGAAAATGAPTREALRGAVERVLHAGGWGNPDVLLVRCGGTRVVVKDFSPRARLVQATLGRWLTARECRAYARLRGIEAVPRWIGRLDALAFAVEYRPGERLSRALAERVPDRFVSDLEQAVAAMHRRGVVHLDLRHRSNVLAGADGRPVVLDFASAICLDPRRRLHRVLIRLLARVDRRALEKWRVRLVRASSRRPSGTAAS